MGDFIDFCLRLLYNSFMIEFIICLIKYTAIFACILYTYTRLLRIKLKVWDLFDIPLFVALSAVLYFATVYVKILVPIGFLIFGVLFLFLRFRKTFYETLTVGTVALGISIVIYVAAVILGSFIAFALHFIKNDSFRILLSNIVIAIIQLVCTFLLFKIKRFKSGLQANKQNATFETLLLISIGCIFSMMLFYTRGAEQELYKIVLLIISLIGLLLIVWWRKHVTYNYREEIKRQNLNRMEDTIEEYKLNSVETELQIAVYSKLFHYLNKAVHDCAVLAESAATQTGNADACAARDMLQKILREMNIANEKCGLSNIPKTGERVIDASIIRLYALSERKNFNASANIFADVESWFTQGKLLKDDIHILISYLSDNAVNSALGSSDAKVRVDFGATKKGEPIIRVYDSGGQFDEGVLAKLGLEQITTRAGAGGSGIGLFTVFEILKKYGASFLLDEDPTEFGFTKFIEIAFDGRHCFTVRTCRESVISACAKRKDIALLPVEELRDGTNG